MIQSIAFYSQSYEDALASIRVMGPADQFSINVIQGVTNGLINFEAINHGEIVVIQRDFPRNLIAYERIIELAHSQNKPVVMDLDDLLFELPDDHPDKETGYYTEALLPMLQAIMEVDLVTVATENLKKYLDPFNKHVEILPNFLNDNLWALKEPQINKSEEEIIIGYMGGHTHKPDLLMILPVLLKLIEKCPNKIKLKFWGVEPPGELAPYSQATWVPPISYRYEDFVSFFQTQSADIMIAPLVENLFNSSKSHIKFLEYTALGVPGVYSRIDPYADQIINGKEGLLASNEIEWEEALSKLIENPLLRRELVINAQKKVIEEMLLSQQAKRFKSIFRELRVDKKECFPIVYNICQELNKKFFNDTATMTNNNPDLNETGYKITSNPIKTINQCDEGGNGKQTLTVKQSSRNKQIEKLTEELVMIQKMITVLTQETVTSSGNIISPLDLIKEKNDQIGILSSKLDENVTEIQNLTYKVKEEENRSYDLFNRLNKQLELEELLRNQITELEEEAVSYAVSKSWKITRPLRRFSRFIKRGQA